MFAVLGQNALAAYIVHGWVGDAFSPFGPKDSPLWWALLLFSAFFYTSYRVVRYLNQHKMFLRL